MSHGSDEDEVEDRPARQGARSVYILQWNMERQELSSRIKDTTF